MRSERQTASVNTYSAQKHDVICASLHPAVLNHPAMTKRTREDPPNNTNTLKVKLCLEVGPGAENKCVQRNILVILKSGFVEKF